MKLHLQRDSFDTKHLVLVFKSQSPADADESVGTVQADIVSATITVLISV